MSGPLQSQRRGTEERALGRLEHYVRLKAMRAIDLRERETQASPGQDTSTPAPDVRTFIKTSGAARCARHRRVPQAAVLAGDDKER